MPRNTSWHQQFLDLLAQGCSFNEAIKLVGSNFRTLLNHFEAMPDFRTQAMHLRQTSGRPKTGGPRRYLKHAQQIIALRTAGLTVEQIAYVLDVPPSTMSYWLLKLEISAEIQDAQRPRWPVNVDDLLELLREIASGATVSGACETVRIPWPTVKRWRRMYDTVDAAIVAAAMDGRTRRVLPVRRLECPGRFCGTKTGYDYGCAEEPCRTEVARREFRRRHPSHEQEISRHA